MSVALNTKWFNTFDSLPFRFVLKTNTLFVWRVLLFVFFLCALPSRPRLAILFHVNRHLWLCLIKFGLWLNSGAEECEKCAECMVHSTRLEQWTFLFKKKKKILFAILSLVCVARRNRWMDESLTCVKWSLVNVACYDSGANERTIQNVSTGSTRKQSLPFNNKNLLWHWIRSRNCHYIPIYLSPS